MFLENSRPFRTIFTRALKRLTLRQSPNFRPSSSFINVHPTPIISFHSESTYRFALLAGGISFSIALVGIGHAVQRTPRSRSLTAVDAEAILRSSGVGAPEFSGAIEALRLAFSESGAVSTDPRELHAYAQSSYTQTPGILSEPFRVFSH